MIKLIIVVLIALAILAWEVGQINPPTKVMRPPKYAPGYKKSRTK